MWDTVGIVSWVCTYSHSVIKEATPERIQASRDAEMGLRQEPTQP